MRHAWICCGAIALLLTVGAAPPPANPSAPFKPDLGRIIQSLGSSDFSVREAAQRELDAIGYDQLSTLQELAARNNDPEVKARLASRIGTIEEILASDPPPISLHLNHASAQEVAAALSKQLAMHLLLESPNPSDFSLDVDRVPFWDAYMQLSQQSTNMFLKSEQYGFLWTGPTRDYFRHEGFVVYAMSLDYQRHVNPQADRTLPVTPPKLTLDLALAADPRVKVIIEPTWLIREMTDDMGNNMNPGIPTVQADSPRWKGQVWNHAIELKLPEKAGTRLKTVAGTATLEVEVSEIHRVIDDVASQVGHELEIGKTKVSIQRFEVANSTLSLGFAASNPESPARVEFNLLDGNGDRVLNYTVINSGFGTGIDAGIKGPFKLEVNVTDRTKKIVIPFELKNIPLP